MALRGTLSDFGIADIFQLVGHQTKTGVLLLKNREQEVRISFVEGNVVKAEKSSRDRADLLGNLMVRARVLTDADLEDALGTQQRTMRRLGDILVEKKYVSLATLKEFTKLQTTETIYRLFVWESGTYEFTSLDSVDHDPVTHSPIRAEEILMEAFRMIDEWPAVRAVISSNTMRLEKARPLPEPPQRQESGEDDLLAGLDDAFDAMEGGGGDDDDDDDDEISRTERIIYDVVTDGCSVQEVIDVSRLGEFESVKAIAHLVTQGFLRAEHDEDDPGDVEPFDARRVLAVFPAIAARVGAYALLAVVVGGALSLVERNDGGLFSSERALVVRSAATKGVLGALHQERLERAIHVYRLLEGRAPATLSELVVAGILTEDDLRGPYRDPYPYRPDVPTSPLARPFR